MSSISGGWRGPSISKNGLLIYLDGLSPNSFPINQSLLSWKDISGNGNNGTLVSSPTLTRNSIGFYTFNGTSQYVNCGNSSNLQITEGSVGAWIKATSGNSSFKGIITKQNAWGLFLIDNVLCAFDWGNYFKSCPPPLGTGAACDINAGIRSTGINLGTNTWTNVMMTFTETRGVSLPGPPQNNVNIYVNGYLVLTTTILHVDHTAPIQFAYANYSPQFFSGSIAQGLVYNKVLTSDEVLQNYNATKSRFGL
jgi:hypothetical protein